MVLKKLLGKAKTKQKGFYDDDSTEYKDAGGSSFYETGDPLAEPEETGDPTRFQWWELVVFIVEGILVIYTLLAFLGFAPLF